MKRKRAVEGRERVEGCSLSQAHEIFLEDTRHVSSKTSDQNFDEGSRAAGADGSLGRQLRAAREARGVSLREISEQTRITMRHLEAIEADDYKNLPGGIFNRSFIKSYARYVDFDEQRALDLYARQMRERGGDQTEETSALHHRSRVYIGDNSRSPIVTAVLSAVILGILILIVYAGLHYYRRTDEGATATAPTEPTPATSAAPGAGGGGAATPTPQPAPADRLSVSVKANSEVWLRVQIDSQPPQEGIWPSGESREFNPQERLTLNYARSLAGALEVTANGARLNVPSDTKPGIQQELVITKENFRQYAQ